MSQNKSPYICVIGAGPCGITVAKNLQEQGLTNFVVFEKNNQIGGNWIYSESDAHSSVYETTHSISSKHLSQYEDFPMPAHYPDYPSHRQLWQYFNDYAENFGVKRFIRFNTEVEHVILQDTRKWEVTYKDEAGRHTALFDVVIVANGHHWDPLMPSYPGKFNGRMFHAHQYKKAAPFKDRRVLVVGGGNSACDIAVEIARVSRKTHISIRSGQHIFPKFIFGKPTDIAFSKIKWMPLRFKERFVSVVIRALQGRYAKYHLKQPSKKPLAVHPTINSELLYFIRHGKVFPSPAIDRFEGDFVHFVDGQKEIFDDIIFATGYKISFPFFNKAFIDYSMQTRIPLYRKMIHPEFDTLYFIGLFQPQGCIWPLADYQAKIAACLIKGTLTKPNQIQADIYKEINDTRNQFKDSPRHALEVDYHVFRNQLFNELKRVEKIH